jgi:uncharacterized protein (TIGR00369 family)
MNDAANWFERMQRGELPPPPVAGLLGQTIRRADPAAGTLEADFVADPRFLNPAGNVQGGLLGAMLDALTAGAVDATVADGESVATLGLHLSFLRPARPGPIEGRARIDRRGREICHVSAELCQDGKPVAGAVAVCTIVRRRALPAHALDAPAPAARVD